MQEWDEVELAHVWVEPLQRCLKVACRLGKHQRVDPLGTQQQRLPGALPAHSAVLLLLHGCVQGVDF